MTGLNSKEVRYKMAVILTFLLSFVSVFWFIIWIIAMDKFDIGDGVDRVFMLFIAFLVPIASVIIAIVKLW